jgi:hypothetical protein
MGIYVHTSTSLRSKFCLHVMENARAKLESRNSVFVEQPAFISLVTAILSPAIKRAGREADHSPPSSAQVKLGGVAPPLPYTPSW